MHDMKKLLVDTILFSASPKQINESEKKNNGKVIVSGVLQRAEAKNQNGRVYPKNILMRECQRYQQEYIDQNRALGELDHPESSVVNLNNVSHNILKIWWDNDDLKGVIQILDTPSGKILKSLFKEDKR